MGKKIKKSDIKLSDQELVPSTIGYMEEEKSSSYGLFILLAVLVAVIVFLPQISNYANKLLGKNTEETASAGTEEDPQQKPDNPEVVTDTKHELSNDLEFTYSDLKFNSFSKSEEDGEYILSCVIENTTDVEIAFSENKYFVELYNGETMLGRHIIDLKSIKVKGKVMLNFRLNKEEYDNVTHVLVNVKTKADYPNYSINKVDERGTLTCESDNGKVVYTFNVKDALIKITDVVSMKNDSTDYNSKLEYYRMIASEYNNLDGVSSNIVDTSTGFTMTTDIEVTKADMETIESEKYYNVNTEPKVVKFEMESRNYSCK